MFYMNTDTHYSSSNIRNKSFQIDEEFMDLDSASAIEIMYVDATVSNLKGLFLCATTADCVPIIYDKVKRLLQQFMQVGKAHQDE